MKDCSVATLFALVALCLGACAAPDAIPTQRAPEGAEGPAVAASVAPEPPSPAEILWLSDDYSEALRQAKEQAKPILVDLWAPWCHTCLSMKHTVLRDPSIAALSDRFVWLALDTDKPVNAAALESLKVSAWPTFFVLGPVPGQVQARLVGSATAPEFRDFLTRGEQGFLDARAEGGALARESPLWWVRQGDRAAAGGDLAAAVTSYDKALADGTLGRRTPDVLVALIGALYKSQQWDACVRLGVERLGDAASARSAKAADFAAYADYCAKHLDDETLVTRLRSAIARSDGPVRRVLDDPTAPLSVDDRADGLRIVRGVLDALGRRDEGTRLAQRQRALLDQAVATATDARAAMTYNWPLCEVYVRLGRPEELVATLQKSVAALPDEYDPAYRLAWILLKAQRPADALAHAEAALDKVYGPRKGRVAWLVADIQKALGDSAAERAARQQVVAIYEGLPQGQAQPSALEKAREALAELDAPPSN